MSDTPTPTAAGAPISEKHLSISQIVVTVTLAIGAITLGLILSYSAPAVESLKDRNVTKFNITDKEISWVASVMPLSGIMGSILGGQLLEFAGRKWTLFSVAVPPIIGWTLIGSAPNIWMVLVGRGLTGVGLGIASVSFQVYMSETVHPSVRGSLGIFGTLAANAGIVLGYALGMFLNWYQFAYFALAAVMPYAILVLVMLPETPRWSLRQGNHEAALKALKWLRPKDYNIDKEFKDFEIAHAEDSKVETNQFKELFRRRNMKPLLITIGAIFSAQIIGVTCLIFFNVTIFKMAGTILSASLSSIITGLGMTFATLIPVLLSDRVGRKVLLIISGVVICLLMTALGAYFYVKHLNYDVTKFTWVPLFSVFSIFVAYSCGYGPIPFLLMGELLPMPIRGIGASIAICGNFLAAFVTTKTFLDLVALVSIHGTFWIYAVITVLTLIFMIFCIPETKRKSLEEIQRKLSANRYRNEEGL